MLPVSLTQKSKMDVFLKKVHFSQRKSPTQFLYVKTFSNKDVRHSLAYLFVQKCLVEDVPFYVKIWPKLIHPLQTRQFSIVIHL